jgi:uncharacterized OB-fold protein
MNGDHSEFSEAYWAGAARGVLVLARCAGCGTVRHYPRPMCAVCHSFDVEHVESIGSGAVHSWTVAHHAFTPEIAEQVPYTLVTVDMAEGVRVLGRLRPPSEPSIGLAVRLTFEPDPRGTPTPVFTTQN